MTSPVYNGNLHTNKMVNFNENMPCCNMYSDKRTHGVRNHCADSTGIPPNTRNIRH